MRGQIRIVITASYNKATLVVMGIRGISTVRYSSIYMKSHIGSSSVSHKSELIPMTSHNLILHECITFDVNRISSRRRIVVSVWGNHRRTGKLEPIGRISFEIRNIRGKQVLHGWYRLRPERISSKTHRRSPGAKTPFPNRVSTPASQLPPQTTTFPHAFHQEYEDASYYEVSERESSSKKQILKPEIGNVAVSVARRAEIMSNQISPLSPIKIVCSPVVVKRIVKLAVERRACEVVGDRKYLSVPKTPTGRRHLRPKNYTPDEIMTSRKSYAKHENSYDVQSTPLLQKQTPFTPFDDITDDIRSTSPSSDRGYHSNSDQDFSVLPLKIDFNSDAESSVPKQKVEETSRRPLSRRLSLDSLMQFRHEMAVKMPSGELGVKGTSQRDWNENGRSTKSKTISNLMTWFQQRKMPETEKKHSGKTGHSCRNSTPRKKTNRCRFRRSLSIRKSKKKALTTETTITAITLTDVLSNKGSTNSFREFLLGEFSVENLDFWLQCEEYKFQKPSKLKKLAKCIHMEYIVSGSKSEVNLDAQTKKAIATRLHSPTNQTFEAAQLRIFELMQKDSFPRYRKLCNI